MIRVLLAWAWLLVFATASADERVDAAFFWKEVVPDADYQMFLASEDIIVCYAAKVAPKDFLVLTRSADAFVIRRIAIPGLPEKAREIAPGVESRSYVNNILVRRDGSDVHVAWLAQVDNTYKIHLLTLRPSGDTTHSEIKEFPKHEPVFNLRMEILGKADLLFFYVYHSEKHLSPISDTGDIAKIWISRRQGGKTQFERQLSPPGQVQNSTYETRRLGDTSFDLVWTEDRHGILGFRNRFGTGRLTLPGEGARFEEIAHVSPFNDDERRQIESISLGSIAADAKGNSQPVISITRREAKSADTRNLRSYRLFSLEGAALRDFAAPASPESMPFDDKSRLWRYLDRPLERGSKPVERHVNWTDFERRRWTEKIVLQREYVAQLVQGPGDCFYWLDGERDSIKLQKVCRPSSQ